MPDLNAAPTLADLQNYVRRLEEERGFAAQTTVEKCLLLGEEIGELFKAVRNAEDIAIDAASPVNEVADELADVMIMLIAVANHSGIDLETAFREKEEKNKTRSWT
jgi:NTP pyrophosphatase (non-canonical NTP hydrolase)